MLIDPAFHQAIGRRVRATECSTVTGPDSITATYRIPVGEALRLLPGAEQTLVSRWAWTSPLVEDRRHGKLVLSIERFPATLEANMSLTCVDGVTTVQFVADFRVNVPLMGRQLEKKAAGTVEQLLAAGQEIGHEWLAEYGN